MERNDPRMQIRLFVFIAFAVFIFIAIISRLAYLQIVKVDELTTMSENNKFRLFNVRAPRGRILDANGVEMAVVRPAFMVEFLYQGTDAQKKVILEKLRTVLNMSPDEMQDVYDNIASGSGRPFEPILVKADVDMTTVTMIEENKTELPGVFVDTQSIRDYPGASLASNILGYVGEINADELASRKTDGYKLGDTIGKMGIERVYDKQLKGVDGGRIVEVDAQGRPIRDNEPIVMRDPVPGDDLVLTIDSRLQKASEDGLREAIRTASRSYHDAKSGAAVAINVKTGAILAMASYPNFDPNLFAKGITKKAWQSLANDPRHVFNDRAISATYPPGSVFKVVTGAAGLESGKFNEHTVFFCPGGYKLGGRLFKCWDHSGHGSLNIEKGFQVSCDVVFYTMGLAVGPDKIAYYGHQFGLGEQSGLDLPGESSGRVPTPEWKKSYFANNKALQHWYPGETLNMSIGQGDNLQTPLQLAMMYATIANGGTLYKPYLVSKIISPEGKTVQEFKPTARRKVNISDNTLRIIRDGLNRVEEVGGTAHAAFNNFDVDVASKTGSAQNGHGNDHALVAAYAPTENPEIAVAVIIEHGAHGGTVAGPVARKILDAYFVKGSQTEQYTGSLMNQDTTIH